MTHMKQHCWNVNRLAPVSHHPHQKARSCLLHLYVCKLEHSCPGPAPRTAIWRTSLAWTQGRSRRRERPVMAQRIVTKSYVIPFAGRLFMFGWVFRTGALERVGARQDAAQPIYPPKLAWV